MPDGYRWRIGGSSTFSFPSKPSKTTSIAAGTGLKPAIPGVSRVEIALIVEMVNRMKSDFSIDDQRIYVEGLSAGGWMVPVLLATYPELFAGGATNAGGPAFCAHTARPFWDIFGWWSRNIGGLKSKTCMNGADKSAHAWGDLVHEKGKSGHRGGWPTISIWQGGADKTVNPLNQQELLEQWTDVHGIDRDPDGEERLGPGLEILHREYRDHRDKALVETYLIPGMGHGTPIIADAERSCGERRRYILKEPVCATRRIGRFWGLNR